MVLPFRGGVNAAGAWRGRRNGRKRKAG